MLLDFPGFWSSPSLRAMHAPAHNCVKVALSQHILAASLKACFVQQMLCNVKGPVWSCLPCADLACAGHVAPQAVKVVLEHKHKGGGTRDAHYQANRGALMP